MGEVRAGRAHDGPDNLAVRDALSALGVLHAHRGQLLRRRVPEQCAVCKGNRGMVAVAANGNVFPCHQMSGYYEQHGDILGNAKREPLSQLLSGGPYLDEVCTTLGHAAREKYKMRGLRLF